MAGGCNEERHLVMDKLIVGAVLHISSDRLELL